MLDSRLLQSGKDYTELKKCYIIFICMQNPFKGKILHKYTFENVCKEDSSISLGDETFKVFVTPDSKSNDITEEMKSFLKYLVDRIPTSEFTQSIHKAVSTAIATKKWRLVYMTLEMRDRENFNDGKAVGLAEGHAEGHAEGLTSGLEALVNTLRGFCKSTDEVYVLVIKNEQYKDVKLETIREIWDK